MPMTTVNGVAEDGTKFGNQSREVDRFPDECPICHKKIVPEFFTTGFENVKLRYLEVFIRCNSVECMRSFIALYPLDHGLSAAKNSRVYRFDRCVPSEPEGKVVSEAVATLSPSFVNIWKQAHSAEALGLDEIAGPGYRKGLEFLIKDYAISLTSKDEEKGDIKNLLLQSVIKKYLGGDKLRVVSSRAAWLGNDETHYERRWVGKDLQDLKRLIEATEHFIAMEKLAADLPTEMPEPGKTS